MLASIAKQIGKPGMLEKINHIKTPLNNGAKVCIIGGGPAGAFFAIELLRGARRLHRTLDVTIIEKKHLRGFDEASWSPQEGISCTGDITPRMYEILKEENIEIPEALILETFSYIWIQCHWKNFPIKIPNSTRMYSLCRGLHPPESGQKCWGLDATLLKIATEEGAHILAGEVRTMAYDANGLPRIAIQTSSHREIQSVNVDFVVMAAGINPPFDKPQGRHTLVQALKNMNPSFIPAEIRKALIFDFNVGRAFIKKYMHKALYLIEYGSRELPLEHIALVPKGESLTISLVGKSIDQASLPEDANTIIDTFLALDHIKRIIPRNNNKQSAITSISFPWMAIRPAKHPVAERLAVIGDASGTRLYKDGLYSAYYMAKTLAEAVLDFGIDRESLTVGYRKTVKWLADDNLYGRLVFGLTRLAFSTNLISRIFYQAFATELKIKNKWQRPFGVLLWKIASGTADYRDIFIEMFSVPVLRSIFIGGVLITLRNLLTEIFFGLKWGAYGRYPTVIVKEKQHQLKTDISTPLGIHLDETLDFERMYIIKIRASRQEVFKTITHFGHAQWNFLKLRFVEVKSINRNADGIGTTIRYSVKGLRLNFDLQLAMAIQDKTLLYSVSDTLADQGQLIFSADSTVDDNTRLVIYTAFNFKKGKTLFGKLFWRLFRTFFPAYAHDVVWNHALCRIKETIEYQSNQ